MPYSNSQRGRCYGQAFNFCPGLFLQMPNPIVARPSSGRAGGHTAASEPGTWGVRVAWKHDVYDGALSTDQTAGEDCITAAAICIQEPCVAYRTTQSPYNVPAMRLKLLMRLGTRQLRLELSNVNSL